MPHRTTARIIAALTILPMPFATALADRSGPRLVATGTWAFDALPRPDIAHVRADLVVGPPLAQRLLALIDGSIVIDGDVRACRGLGDSCSLANGDARPWRIHLDRDTRAGTYPSQRFLVLHEVGHAVWGLVFTDADRRAFVADVSRSLAGDPCRRQPGGGPCAALGEVFADEFARWAGGYHVSMTWYETPALLGVHTFDALIERALAHAAAA